MSRQGDSAEKEPIMRRALGLLALLGVFAMAPIRDAHAVRILGQGTDNCDVWMRARTGPEKNEYREWFLGYLSASAFLKNNDILRDMSYEDVITQVLRACERNPSKRLDEVLDDFFR
jgi:hypothetical protein